jgi:hypothetical protein
LILIRISRVRGGGYLPLADSLQLTGLDRQPVALRQRRDGDVTGDVAYLREAGRDEVARQGRITQRGGLLVARAEPERDEGAEGAARCGDEDRGILVPARGTIQSGMRTSMPSRTNWITATRRHQA